MKRTALGASALLVAAALAGCAAAPDTGADHERVCAARGLAPGSDDFVHCVEQQHLKEQDDSRRMRQTRDLLGRGGGRL